MPSLSTSLLICGYRHATKEFPTTDVLLESKETELAALKKDIAGYFTAQGSTPDSIADVDRATSNVTRLTNEINDLQKQIQTKNGLLSALISQTRDLKLIANECESIVKTRLLNINKDLKISNDNVEEIKFDYRFNKDKFIAAVNSDFYEYFKSYHKSGLSWDNVYTCLHQMEHSEDLLSMNHDEFLSKLETKDFYKNSMYGKVYKDIMDKPANFQIYQLIVRKHFYNFSNNVEIIGFYGASPLSSCSFGQRCTAVIVTLLMTGMKPLIIDEPEAHLDNRLIAEYLVDLIKEKKNERQIIFATHNANFVLNGDAELIHILEVPKNSEFTEITSTTIEDLSQRDRLLRLEGGKEAFMKRDDKLLSGTKTSRRFLFAPQDQLNSKGVPDDKKYQIQDNNS